MKTYLFNGIETQQVTLPQNINQLINIYEVVRVQSRIVLFAEDHFSRFCNSLKIGNQKIDVEFKLWTEKLNRMGLLNNIENSNIRLDRYYQSDGTYTEVISPLQSIYPTLEEITNGVATILQFDERNNPNAKISDYNVRNKANDMLTLNKAYESILVNHLNLITEGSRSNIFAIKNNQLYTAPDHLVLQGIMRKKVIDAANELHIIITYEAINTSDINNIDAMFITGTSPRVLPIKTINDKTLITNHPIIIQLRNKIENMVIKYIEDHSKSTI